MSETPKLWAPDGTARLLATADELEATVNDGPVNGPDIPQFLEQVGLRPATADEIRAAVVPLLDLEAAAKAWHDHSVPELYMDVSSWSDCDDLYRDQVRAHVRIAVYAALGLGEEP